MVIRQHERERARADCAEWAPVRKQLPIVAPQDAAMPRQGEHDATGGVDL